MNTMVKVKLGAYAIVVCGCGAPLQLSFHSGLWWGDNPEHRANVNSCVATVHLSQVSPGTHLLTDRKMRMKSWMSYVPFTQAWIKSLVREFIHRSAYHFTIFVQNILIIKNMKCTSEAIDHV